MNFVEKRKSREKKVEIKENAEQAMMISKVNEQKIWIETTKVKKKEKKKMKQ